MPILTTLHPFHRLCSWLLLVLAVQCLPPLAMVLLLLALPVVGRESLLRWRGLMLRTRWLMLSLVLILGWTVAGEPVWTASFVPPPSHEGLQDAMTQLLRLSLALAAVAILVTTTALSELMAGCRTLLLPISVLGLDVDRAVARLSLVLHFAESAPQAGWREWLAAAPEGEGPEEVVVPSPQPAWRDRMVLAASAALLGMAYLA